jgi:predicted MPP superfamily phosphohydrolase
MLAGHTHCGQIRLPWYGAIGTVSRYGERFECGLIREDGRTLIVGAGVGTSILPLRLGAPPDLWLVRLGPVRSAAAR